MAALAPRLRVETSVEALGPDVAVVSAVVTNEGYLPTTFVPSAASLPFVEGLRAELVVPAEATLEGGAPAATQPLGQLAGWGMHENVTPLFPRSWSGPTKARARWVVRGAGEAEVRVSSARCGALAAKVRIG
jgi:hypothetical protein